MSLFSINHTMRSTLSYVQDNVGGITLTPLQKKIGMIALAILGCIVAVMGTVWLYRKYKVTTMADQGNKLLKEDKFEEAVVHYEKALKIDPKAVGVLTNYGAALVRISQSLRKADKVEEADKQFAKGEEQFKKALEIAPKDAASLFGYGTVSRLQGKYEEAAKYYEKVLEIHPTSIVVLGTYARVLFNHSEALKAEGKMDEAEKLLAKRDAQKEKMDKSSWDDADSLFGLASSKGKDISKDGVFITVGLRDDISCFFGEVDERIANKKAEAAAAAQPQVQTK